jgi:PAS domain S-box-containing protein
VLDSITRVWSQSGQAGVISRDDGTVLFSLLPAEETVEIVPRLKSGYYVLGMKRGSYHCFSSAFPLWGWTVTTVIPHSASYMGRKEVLLIVPIIGVGALLIIGGVYLILRRNLQQPVAMMVNAVNAGGDLPKTGVAEFDHVGAAVNSALAKVRERTGQLAVELEERRRAETALLEEKNKFEAIIDTMGEGLSIQDRNFRVLYQNEVHQDFVGPHVGELCYQAFQSKTNPCQGCPVALAFQDGKVHTVERVKDLPGGGTRYFEVAASPLRNAAGEVVAGIELVRDVTERKRTEQQLQQAHKMEAIGQLAGGVAHDFNNILTAITGYASFLKVKTEEGSQLRYYGEQILHAAEKAANLTRQILAFSRKQVISPRLVRINEIIKGMEKMILRLLGEDIEIHIQLADQDTTVMADPGQIEQVLLNLATNARDAMPAGGKLHIKTEIASLDEQTARSKGVGKSGEFVLISFSDTGEGMSEKVRQRIFEPFFTTKEMGRGTGLGLSIVYGIVTQHEGQINVYSEPGEGTSFRVYLPHAVQPSMPQPVRQEEPNIGGKGETILIAEDDEAVRNVARLTLEESGYRVILAVDGEDAVTKFREHKDEIRLCLLDLIMPKKNGKAALNEIRSLRRDIPALFMSGYAADIIKSKDLAEMDVEVTDKPLIPQSLLKRVRALLDAPPPGSGAG